MNISPEQFGPDSLNDLFYKKADEAFNELFERARNTNELQFAFALSPEFRGAQDAGWNTALDAKHAFEDYLQFLRKDEEPGIRARVALGFYSYLSEASGFYEVPKNMLRIGSGHDYNLWPFQRLVKKHKETGARIAPNSNKIISDLAGHAFDLGLTMLAEVLRDAFDPDLRNGYAHADYVIWHDGVRLPKRNGGSPRLVGWTEFNQRLERAVEFFRILDQVHNKYICSYAPPKFIKARLHGAPEETWRICFDPDRQSFSISNTPGAG